MDYTTIPFPSASQDLTIKVPVNHRETVVFEGPIGLRDPTLLKSVLDRLRTIGVKNVVVDFSSFPAECRMDNLAVLEGAIGRMYGFKTRYAGISADKTYFKESSFRDSIAPKIFERLDDAVESFSE